MADDPLADQKKALQAEVVAVKQRWSDEVKLIKADKGTPKFPLPLAVVRAITRPEAAYAYDVEAITVRLWVESLEVAAGDAAPVRVEVSGVFPDELQRAMSAHVEQRWRGELAARGAGKGWLLEKVLAWAEGAYAELLELVPELVEQYDGCDDNGMTIRRYAIAEPPPPKEEASEEEASEEEVSEEESSDDDPARLAERISLEREQRIKEKAEAEADRLWREERRREAEALGDDAPPRVIGKKEQARLQQEKKEAKGARMRKTGSKANKANMKEREDAKARTNKKNGLMH